MPRSHPIARPSSLIARLFGPLVARPSGPPVAATVGHTASFALGALVGLGAVVGSAVASTTIAPRDATPTGTSERPIPRNLLEPLPRFGAVPPIVQDPEVPSLYEIIARGWGRGDREAIDEIVRLQLRNRDPQVRAEGFAALARFDDAAAMVPLVDGLVDAGPETRAWLLDHLADLDSEGQFGLAYAFIAIDDGDFRRAVLDRLDRPLPTLALHAIDAGVRHSKHTYVNAAGWLAAHFNVIEAIPPLIFAQAADARFESQGDLAWIAIGTTTAYVQNVVPVVGGSAGAFQPILGTIQSGTLLRVMDAVVVESGGAGGYLLGSSLHGMGRGMHGDTLTGATRVTSGGQIAASIGLRSGRIAAYRLDAHNALVSLSSVAWARPTDHMGFDMRAWYRWFNEDLVPHMREEEEIRRVAADVGP